MVYITCKCEVPSLNSQQVFYSIYWKLVQSPVNELDGCFVGNEFAFRVEEVVENSFTKYIFRQEILVFERKLSGKVRKIRN